MSNPDLHAYWQQTLSDWQDSDLSGAAFCRQRSLSYHQFGYWRRKLNGTTDHKRTSVTSSGFARVAPLSEARAADSLAVSLPGGVSVTGLHAGNIELLGAILRQL